LLRCRAQFVELHSGMLVPAGGDARVKGNTDGANGTALHNTCFRYYTVRCSSST
jgi:hypothetical protein